MYCDGMFFIVVFWDIVIGYCVVVVFGVVVIFVRRFGGGGGVFRVVEVFVGDVVDCFGVIVKVR